MKATYIAVVALGAAIMAAYLVYPAFATTTPASTSLTTNPSSAVSTPSTATTPMPAPMQRGGGFFGGRGGGPLAGGRGGGPLGGRGGQGQGQAATFSNGQTITLTSTNGSYFVVGTQGKTNGTASGTLTF